MIRTGLACLLVTLAMASAVLAQATYVPGPDGQPRRTNRGLVPGAVLPVDRGALEAALAGSLDTVAPDRPTTRTMPSGARYEIVASRAFVRRTGEPCINCRVPCRTYRYRYVRPDRGSVVVEGLRCRRPNGRWAPGEPDVVVAERPAQPGLAVPMGPGEGAPAGSARPPRLAAEPTPVPVRRPGTTADGGPATGVEPGPAGDLAAAEPGPASPEETDEMPAPGTIPPPADNPPAEAGPSPGAPMPLGPDAGAQDVPSDEAEPPSAEAPSAEPPTAATPPAPTSPAPTPPAAAQPAAPTRPAPADRTAAAEATTPRVVMPYGTNEGKPAAGSSAPIAVDTVADPGLVRLLRQLSYLDPASGAEPTPAQVKAAVAEFAADEKLTLPMPTAEIKAKLEAAIDRTADLSSCSGATEGFGVCLTPR